MTRKKKSTKRAGDRFAQDEIVGEYSKASTPVNSDAAAIASGLSQLSKRAKTGWVEDWIPTWAKRAKLPPFMFYFNEDKLAVDFFNREHDRELDALADDLTPDQRQEISHKTTLCGEHGIGYLILGPDDELDITQLASKVGKTTYKKGSERTLSRAGAKDAGDGISEEGDTL